MVLRPDAKGTFPLLSYAHGYGNGGGDPDKGDGIYVFSDKLSKIAAEGFIVVANRSGASEVCAETLDQIRSIEWAKESTSAINKYVDWNS